MDEARLIERLLAIEALHAGATTRGERVAAERAVARILERLRTLEAEDPPVEYKFTMGDMWSRKVFVALCRRYGLRPYRYKRQRYTTVMVRVSRRFVDETLWPEFRQLSETLQTYLTEVTDRVVTQVLHPDTSDADVTERPRQLTLAAASSTPPPPTSPAPPPPPGPATPASASTSEAPPPPAEGDPSPEEGKPLSGRGARGRRGKKGQRGRRGKRKKR